MKKSNKFNSFNPSDFAQRVLIIIMLAWFLIFLIVPMITIFSQVFMDNGGNWVGLENFKEYFSNEALSISIIHSISVSVITASISTVLGLLFAYGITRTNMKFKGFYRYVAMIPLFLPTMVHGMALIYIFGKMGFVTQYGIDIGLYGKTGIIMAEVFYTFPQAFLVLIVALQSADNRLYEAASVLGSNPVKTFFRITLPNIKYGVVNAFIVCFTLSFTDFGAPQVVGGNYNVLATDIYKQVVGQQNMSMGAVVGVILTIPAFLAFLIDLFMRRKSASDELSSKAVAFVPEQSKVRDIAYQIFCTLIVLVNVILLASILMSALVKRWPNDMTFTLKHFDFGSKLVGSGAVSFWNSFKLSIGAAIVGTIIVFSTAYLIERAKPMAKVRSFCRFTSMMPMALPGLVLGLSYIMFFNKQWIDLPFVNLSVSNPFNGLYGTMAIMILCNVIHMYSVTFVTATTAVKKLDREYENVADSMSVPFWVVFFKVSLPMSITAVLEIFVYYFVNSMVTVSAIVFLYNTTNKPAAIAVLNMDDNGDYAAAAAMSILILLINVAVRLLYELVNMKLTKKVDRWKKGDVKLNPVTRDLSVDQIELDLMEQMKQANN